LLNKLLIKGEKIAVLNFAIYNFDAILLYIFYYILYASIKSVDTKIFEKY